MDTNVLQSMWDAFWPKAFDLGKTLIIVLLIWIIGKKLIKLALNLLKKGLERGKVEAGVETFLMSLVRIVLHGILILTIAGTIGFETTSVVTLVGSAGLTIGLALQGSLSNFAGGVLILILKPFVIGDYIVVGGDEGTVTSIDIFYTKLLTPDNRCIVLPNGALSNSNLVNVTNQKKRRIDLVISVAYDSDIDKVKAVLLDLAKNHEFVLQEEPQMAFISQFAASSIDMNLRFWVASENYWTTLWDMREKVKAAFDANGITIPFNQLDVSIKKGE